MKLIVFALLALSAFACFPLAAQTNQHATGDSITYGINWNNSSNAGSPACVTPGSQTCYAALIANNASIASSTFANEGIGGSMACDIADQQVFKNEYPTTSNNPIRTIMSGYNDAIFKNTGSYESVTNLCNEASFSYMAIPTANKIAGWKGTQTGTWAIDQRYALNGAYSTTNGSTLTFSVTTTGAPIYIWYRLIDGSGGTFTYAINGGSATTVTTATSPAMNTNLEGSSSLGVGVVRIPESSGTYSVAINVTSSTSTSNSVGIVAVGTAPSSYSGTLPPKVYVGGIIKVQSDQYSTYTAAYNTDVANVVSTLSGDGLPVYFINVRNYICTQLNSSSTYCENPSGTLDMDNDTANADHLHPNTVGHADLAAAWNATVTTGGGTSVPDIPTSLTASPGSNTVSLGWTAPNGASTYNVYRGTATGNEGSTAIATGISGTAYSDNTAVNGTTYYYTVSSINSGGTGGQSHEASATPSGGGGGGSAFATLGTTTTERNNFTGWIGFEFTVGSTPITITALARYCFTTDTTSHTVDLVTVTSPTVVGSVSVNCAGVGSNGWVYANLGSSYTTSASASYYVVSQETSGGDSWWNSDTTIVPASVATVPNAVYTSNTPPTSGWNITSGTNNGFGPPNFQYTTGGGGSPGISLSPTSLVFGSQAVGTTSASQNITVTNTGTATLTISSVTITGSNAGDFGQSNGCSSVAASGTCTISVTFTPTATGTRAASVSITDNASGSPHTVGLSGTGAASATINCSPAYAVAGGTTTCTATSSVTWSVTGGGSITAGPSSTATYTAPTGVVAQNSMLGVNVMPNDVVFNQRVDNAGFPLDANSTTKIATLPSTTLTIQPAWGISYADSVTTPRNLLAYYNEVSYTGFPNQTSPSLLYRENGNKVGVFNNSSDHHSMIVNRSTGTFYETYNDYLSGYTRTCNDGSTANCNVQSATTYASTAYTFPSTANYNNGTDAAGLPLAPLVWHLDELKSGVINHAVRVTWNGQFNAGTFVWPASAYAGGTSGSPTTRTQLGDRLRLKSAYSITGACGTSPSVGSAGYYCTVGLTALAHYGMVIADTGTNNAIIVASDVESDPAVTAGLQMIAAAAIAPTNFEIVNEQALKVAANNYIVAPQSYATPLNQIVVSGSGASNTVNVAIQPVGVGSTLNPTLYLEAGSYTVSLSPFFWVVPSSVLQTINYAIPNNTCSSGSISGSTLTVPTTGGCTLQITATSAYDSAAVSTRYVTVLAMGTSPANSVRIDSGKTTSTTDGNGNVWAADLGMIGQQAQNGSDNAWPQTNPYLTVYQSDDYSQQDLHYQMLVPNGNYQVQLLFGKLHEGGGCNNQPCGTWPTISSGYYPLLGYLPIWIETQGAFVSTTLDWGAQQGYLYTTPYSAFVPATVSNNLLEVGVGMYAPDSGPNYNGANYGQSGNKYVTVNGIAVLPDTTSAYLTVDPAANAPNMRVAVGASTQPFYSVAHYFSGGTTTWAVVTNSTGLSASLAADGWGDGGEVLTLGSGTAKNGGIVTIQATNGSYVSPAMAFYVAGASTTLTQNPLDPAIGTSFSSAVSGMTQTNSYTFGSGTGRNMQNATNLATAFSRYGIAGSTVINQTWQVFQPFTTTANYVFNSGNLTLTGTATALSAGNIQSGQLASLATFGPPGAPNQPNVLAFEINAQMPSGAGSWPAMWFFKPSNNAANGTQELNSPEIDYEFFVDGVNTVYTATAYNHVLQSELQSFAPNVGPQGNVAGSFLALPNCSGTCYSPGADFSAGFHLYQMMITPDAVFKWIDGVMVQATAFKWTSPTGLQLLLTLNIGSSSIGGLQPTSLSDFPSKYQMAIEHVTAYAK